MTREHPATTRREFLKTTGRIAAVSALAGSAVPHVHAAENNTIQVALIGCGLRGNGAVVQALSVNSPTKLVAMAEMFEPKLESSYNAIKKELKDKFESKVDVPKERQFVGFDAYKKAIDCLKPGDVAIFATPPGFRWVHFTYAIEKGVNVFMEKPITVDGPSTRRMLALGEQAAQKNLKVGVGLMVRHCKARQALLQRIQDGQLGELIALRAYRMHGPVVGYYGPKKDDISDLLFQIRQFHGFLWASGGTFSDFYIHQIDECCWMKGTWPVSAEAIGGRHYRGDCIDQNFDTYDVEYTFPDGTKLFLAGRSINGCNERTASYAHGTKGSAIVSFHSHRPGKCRIFKGQDIKKNEDMVWAFPQPEPNPYQNEWDDLIEAIRQDKPYNEVKRGAEASLVTCMGRFAAHTGQIVTFDDMLNHEHEFAPELDKLTMASPAPLLAGADGKYPIPQPGIVKTREY
jgi:predicted dehydrogenase